MADYHGWGSAETMLSVTGHPTKKGKAALLLTHGSTSRVLAEFFSEDDAVDFMDWQDAAFNSARAMNQRLLDLASPQGG